MTSQQNTPTDALAPEHVFAALSDPLRLRIVRRLAAEGRLGCSQIDHNLSLSTVSLHCKVLREAGIVTSEAVGTQRVLVLRPEFARQFAGVLATIAELDKAK